MSACVCSERKGERKSVRRCHHVEIRLTHREMKRRINSHSLWTRSNIFYVQLIQIAKCWWIQRSQNQKRNLYSTYRPFVARFWSIFSLQLIRMQNKNNENDTNNVALSLITFLKTFSIALFSLFVHEKPKRPHWMEINLNYERVNRRSQQLKNKPFSLSFSFFAGNFITKEECIRRKDLKQKLLTKNCQIFFSSEWKHKHWWS